MVVVVVSMDSSIRDVGSWSLTITCGSLSHKSDKRLRDEEERFVADKSSRLCEEEHRSMDGRNIRREDDDDSSGRVLLVNNNKRLEECCLVDSMSIRREEVCWSSSRKGGVGNGLVLVPKRRRSPSSISSLSSSFL